jgi:hypothetical protein
MCVREPPIRGVTRTAAARNSRQRQPCPEAVSGSLTAASPAWPLQRTCTLLYGLVCGRRAAEPRYGRPFGDLASRSAAACHPSGVARSASSTRCKLRSCPLHRIDRDQSARRLYLQHGTAMDSTVGLNQPPVAHRTNLEMAGPWSDARPSPLSLRSVRPACPPHAPPHGIGGRM